MSLELIQNKILPQLLKNQVVKITLTGGEPLCNPQIKDIVQLLLDNHIGVSICTNATLIDTHGLLIFQNMKMYILMSVWTV